MKQRIWRLWAAAMVACLASTAGAATVKASVGVSVTVVESCRIVPGQAAGCTPAAQAEAAAMPAPKPLVTYSHDPRTGATVETIAF